MDQPNLGDFAENLPVESGEPDRIEKGGHAELAEARTSRAMDYLISSLEKDDPLQSNLGSINSGLIKITYDVEKCLAELMKDGPLTAEQIQQIAPTLNTYLRLTRQIRCFADIELRAGEARKSGIKQMNAKSCSDARKDAQSEDSSF